MRNPLKVLGGAIKRALITPPMEGTVTYVESANFRNTTPITSSSMCANWEIQAAYEEESDTGYIIHILGNDGKTYAGYVINPPKTPVVDEKVKFKQSSFFKYTFSEKDEENPGEIIKHFSYFKPIPAQTPQTEEPAAAA